MSSSGEFPIFGERRPDHNCFRFAEDLGKACVQTIEGGGMTKDLSRLIDLDNKEKGECLIARE